MRREAVLTLGVVAAAGAMLWLVFWVLRGWPDLPHCWSQLTSAQEREVSAFRRGHLPLHAVAGLAIGAMIWRLTAAHRRTSRDRNGVVIALAIVAMVVVVSLVFDDVLIVFVFAYFFSFVIAPLTLLLGVVAGALLMSRRTVRAGALLTL